MNLDVSMSSSDYQKKNIELVENSPEEIRDLVVEMVDRLDGVWVDSPDDIKNRKLFQSIFSNSKKDIKFQSDFLITH